MLVIPRHFVWNTMNRVRDENDLTVLRATKKKSENELKYCTQCNIMSRFRILAYKERLRVEFRIWVQTGTNLR